MQYVGIQTQQRRNNQKSLLLLILFPLLVVGMVFLFCYLLVLLSDNGYAPRPEIINTSFLVFLQIAPWVLGGILIWFLIAYFTNTRIISSATGSRPLERKENKRIYNLVENLCMTQGMKMPMINVIEDYSLNAFASGINDKTYTVTLTRGIIERLDDQELEGVIAHELMHIRNRDVRLLIVSIIFVGIFTMIAQIALRSLYYAPRPRSNNNKNNNGLLLILLAMVVALIGYFFSTLMRFAISRNREYMADAGAAEMTKNPMALANALRKISSNPNVEAVEREDIAQLFIEHPGKGKKSNFLGQMNSLFATHPPIEKRIKTLEQF